MTNHTPIEETHFETITEGERLARSFMAEYSHALNNTTYSGPIEEHISNMNKLYREEE